MKETLSARNRAKICLRYNFLIGLKRRESVFNLWIFRWEANIFHENFNRIKTYFDLHQATEVSLNGAFELLPVWSMFLFLRNGDDHLYKTESNIRRRNLP